MLDKALGSMASPDQYYFQIRLTTLKCTHTEPLSFRVSIQKGLQKVDNTKDLFTIEGTECSLNEEPLNFYLPSYNPNRSIDFTIVLIDQEQKPITSFKISSGQFIAEYIKSGKNTFSLTDKFQDENYELEYSLFIEKSRAALLSLTRKPSQLQSPKLPDIKSPQKEEPTVQPTRSQITRSPVITRHLTPKPKGVSRTTSKTEQKSDVVETPIQEPVNQTLKQPVRTIAPLKTHSSARKVDVDPPQQPQRTPNVPDIKQNKSPIARSYQRPQKVEPELIRQEEVSVEQPKKVEPPKRAEQPKRAPIKQPEERIEQMRVQEIRKIVSTTIEVPAEELKGKPVKKIEAPAKKEVKDGKNVLQEKIERKANPAPIPNKENRQSVKAKPEKESGGSGNRNKLIVVALVVAVIIFGLIFAGGSKETKKRPVRKGKN